MSAFGFISGSRPLNSLLIEDLYDSQQWGSSSSSSSSTPPLRSRSSPSTTRSKPMQTSFFSIIDDISDQKPENSPSQSGFNFMSQSSSDISNTSKRHKVIKPNNEMKLISATSLLYRLSTEKTNSMHTLHRLYARQWQTQEQMIQLKNKIQMLCQQQDIALAAEDFLVAETLQSQEEKMKQSLNELEHEQIIKTQLYAAWDHLSGIVAQEAEAAKEVLKCSEDVKEERYLQYMKFVTDRERMHQQRLEELNQGRSVIESEKSEVAFDLGLWEQSHQDLVEREDDTIHEEKLKQQELNTQVDLVQQEIDDLQLKLNVLQTKKKALVTDISELESVMHEKLEPFSPERQEQEQEYERIRIRQEEIQQKTQALDEQEKWMDMEIQKHAKEKDRGLDELSSLDEQMENASEISQQDATLFHKILKQIQTRDQAILELESELQKSREALFRKRGMIEGIQNDFYSKQQEQMQWEETLSEHEQKLKRLEKLKQVAVETRRFQQAAALSNQIKTVTDELNLLKSQKVNIEQDQTLLKAQQELSEMEQAHETLEKTRSTEIKLLLEQFKNEHQDKVIPLLAQELDLIQLQLQNLDILSN